jgi:hypothetical protein
VAVVGRHRAPFDRLLRALAFTVAALLTTLGLLYLWIGFELFAR